MIKEIEAGKRILLIITDPQEKKMVMEQIEELRQVFKKTAFVIQKILELHKFPFTKIIAEKMIKHEIPQIIQTKTKIKLSELEEKTLKNLRQIESKEEKERVEKPNKYVKISNQIFSDMALRIINKGYFKSLKRDLIRGNIQILPTGYVSMILFTMILSIFAAIVLFLFFLFFNIEPVLPIITRFTGSYLLRAAKIFVILIAVPLITFLIMYFYPSMEKKSVENKINQELPFATIHMAAISSSMIEPTKIFTILIATKEYPALTKEFTKLINQINVYGYNLVGALKYSSANTASQKLSELFNGLAVTITSGGDLSDFFDKRSETLLFDYRIEREKYTRAAETFMDIYISVVIAAPMILMLLLMMMKITGLGIMFSTNMISLLMVLGVAFINIVFITFLHLKQPAK